MAIRINKARNFAGKSYVVTSEITQLLSQLNLNDNLVLSLGSATTFEDGTSLTIGTIDLTPVKTAAVTAVTGDNLTADNIVLGNTAGSVKTTGKTIGGATLAIESGVASDDVLATEAGVKAYVDGHAIGVTAGNGITIDKTDALNPVISTNLKITKVDTTTGFAASYKLQYLGANDTYTDVDGDTIDIVKDQFIKSATFGWSTATDATGAGWTTTKSETAKYPCIKIEVWTNVDGDASSSDSTATELYIPLNDVFADKTAGVGIDSAALAGSNVIAVSVDGTSGKVVAASGAAAVDVLSVSTSGVKVANIQEAIDVAVNNEHAKMAAAVSAVDGKVVALGSAANAAVTALNTRVETVASNAAAAAGNAEANAVAYASSVASNAATAINDVQNAVSAVDSKVDAAFDAIDTAVETAIDAVQTSVTAHTANAVQVLESAVTVTSGANGVATATVTANNILGVFEAGSQVYPEIARVAAASNAGYGFTYTLTADYGTATVPKTWDVVYTMPLAAYTAVDVADTDYATAGSYAAKTVTGTAGDSATTVAAGDAATAPSAPSATTVGALDYKPTA